MPTYDFRALNDKDFEAIVVDLLGSLEGRRIERFKPGRDKGVDGRFFSADGGESIIQCKHWVESGYAKLLADLKKSELPKVQRLKCRRYILATSVPLSRHQKGQLKESLAPFILVESDILGPEDINDLLGRHSEVERRHYRLWLSSVIPLTQVFNNAIVGRSRAELEDIRDEAPLYVGTRDYKYAVERLDKDQVLILTGQPGIGKTTLARQLILEHVARGFELVKIEDDLAEAESVFTEDSRQFFYYDDFLGRTYLEALSPKQDSHSVSFIRRVARSKNKRFVLTSRTGILNQGAALSDLFADLFERRRPFELRVEHLTPMDRARILYNHLWHSRLGREYIDQLYTDKRYHGVIGHKNFNPRLVALVLDNGRVGDIPPDKYWPFVKRTLERPADLWDHVFANQLDQAGRDLAILTVVHGQPISEQALRSAFGAVPARLNQHAGQVEQDFRRATKDAGGSVLQRFIDASSRSVTYDVFNPSIADHVQAQLTEADLWGYYLPCIRSRHALDQLEQLSKGNGLSSSQYEAALRKVAAAEEAQNDPSDSYTWRVIRALLAAPSTATEFKQFVEQRLSDPLQDSDIEVEDYLSILARCERFVARDAAAAFAKVLPDVVETMGVPIDDPALTRAALAALERLGDERSVAALRRELIEAWREYARDAVQDQGILSSYCDPDDADTATNELRKYFRDQLQELGFTPTDNEVDVLMSRISVEDVILENQGADDRADQQFEEYRERRYEEKMQADAIDDLFERES